MSATCSSERLRDLQAASTFGRLCLARQVISFQQFLVLGLEYSITRARLGKDEKSHDREG